MGVLFGGSCDSWMESSTVQFVDGIWCPKCGAKMYGKAVRRRKHWWTRKIGRTFWVCYRCDFTEDFNAKIETVLCTDPGSVKE